MSPDKPDPKDRLFEVLSLHRVGKNAYKFRDNLVPMLLWGNIDLAATFFSGKQNNGYWKATFETGRRPHGMVVTQEPINLIEMRK